MRKKILMLLFNLGYYALCLPICTVFFLVSEIMFIFIAGFSGASYMVWYLLLIATPIIVVVVTRFSIMKWYVDPIVAIEVPFVIYVSAILAPMLSWDMSFYDSFLRYNEQLSADGGKGWFFLLGLFVISLAASFSLARTRGKSISYRVISKFTM